MTMQRVIVSVKRMGDTGERDIELPAEVEAERLSQMIAGALRWELAYEGRPITYSIEAQPPGRLLQPQESLADAGVWDGAWLVMQPSQAMAPAVQQPAAPPRPASVVRSWSSLGIDIPPEATNEPAQPEEKKPSRFSWKQLDSDQ